MEKENKNLFYAWRCPTITKNWISVLVRWHANDGQFTPLISSSVKIAQVMCRDNWETTTPDDDDDDDDDNDDLSIYQYNSSSISYFLRNESNNKMISNSLYYNNFYY